jgi:hypothetical protein
MCASLKGIFHDDGCRIFACEFVGDDAPDRLVLCASWCVVAHGAMTYFACPLEGRGKKVHVQLYRV